MSSADPVGLQKPAAEPSAPSADLSHDWPMLLAGEWVCRERTTPVRDPQDGSVVGTVPRADDADLETAAAAAVEGRRRARDLTARERMDLLQEAADRVEESAELFARTIATEGIKTIREARKEVSRGVQTLRLSAEEARRIGGRTLTFDQAPGGEDRTGYYTREPVGVVLAITPYNDPLNLVAHKLGPALAAGNAVILKPDSKTPLTGLLLARALDDAGAPPGVLQAITAPGAAVGERLVPDPRVRMISFTGGRATGEAVLRRAGLKRVTMELGSNSPVVVMPDADLDRALEATVSGAFSAAGQNCLHVQRLLLHREIYATFSERFVEAARRLRVGDKLDEATDMGCMITREAAREVEAMVTEALDAGARLLTGGERDGTLVDPTVLDRLPEDCSLATEEVYGPVTVLYEIADLDEAVARANEVDYGLQAAIFTRDVDTALRASRELECGGVMINDSTDYRLDAMPFGGVKGSGIGREGVEFAVREMTEPKVVCFNEQR